MSSEIELQSRLQTAVQRALILNGKTRISRTLYESSFSLQEPDPRRKPQNAQRPYHLVESEYSFLNTGEPPGSYQDRPDKLHSRVEDKVNRLPDRIELLLEDISMLSEPPFSEREALFDVSDGDEYGYFTAEQWGDAWLDLMGIYPQEDLTDVFSDRSSSYHNPAGEFGQKLGRLWASLMLYPENISPQQLWIDAVKGFVDGLYLNNPHLGERARPQQRRKFIETLVDEVETWAMEEIDTKAKSEQEWFDEWKDRDKIDRKTRKRITKILENEGIDPVYVRNYIYFELTDHLRQRPSKSSIEDEITPDIVVKLVEEEQLRAKAAIMAKLSDDAEAIREKSGKGPDPDAILETIYRGEGYSSLEIAKQCTKREHQPGVTETATDMAGQKDPDDRPGRVWNEIPILEGDPEGWSLTTYGCLLAEHMFDGHLGYEVSDLTDDHIELLDPVLEY